MGAQKAKANNKREGGIGQRASTDVRLFFDLWERSCGKNISVERMHIRVQAEGNIRRALRGEISRRSAQIQQGMNDRDV